MEQPTMGMFGEIPLPDGTRHIFLAEPARNLWKETGMRYATAEPNPDAKLAEQRHRDGMSCKTITVYGYDANGYKRWCIDCGAELGEQAWHPDGADVGPRGIGAVFAFAGLLGLLVLCLLFGSAMTDGTGTPVPPHVPTTYGPPPTVVP